VSSSPILLIDNFDSFTFNVMHGLVEAGADVEVRRADALTADIVETFDPAMIVISPGPGRPEDARLSLDVCRGFGGRVPILGICLGMQMMAVAFGGAVGRAREPVHGKTSEVLHDGRGLFDGLPSPMTVGRYHSLCVTRAPECVEITARTADGVVMGLRHKEFPMAGVQFHPDSFLSPFGKEMLRNAVHGRL
jgi:anthranilate synthase/aminodeoxychorismate synthase-like glutamine amidotransferase